MGAVCRQQASSVGLTPSLAHRAVPGTPGPPGCLHAWTDRSLDRHRLWDAKLGGLHKNNTEMYACGGEVVDISQKSI